MKAREALYGGAAGGGKSDALLMGALMWVDVPTYSALIIRKTYADLSKPGGLLDRAYAWLNGTGAEWSGQKKSWQFPSGAKISFGHMETKNDHYQYQGAEYQYIAFDELTQLPEYQYRYLFSRRRRLADVDVPLLMRAGTNPGGDGHDWVKKRFIDNPHPNRAYIPATLEDNPSLDRDEYDEGLQQLSEVEYKRLRHGDWYVQREGLVYPGLAACMVPHVLVPTVGRFNGGIDYGYSNPFAAVWGPIDHDDVMWFEDEHFGSGLTISQHALCLPRKVGLWWADPAGADQTAELRAANFSVNPCVHRKVRGGGASAKSSVDSGIDWVNERIRTGRAKFSERCKNILRESGDYHFGPDGQPVDENNHALSAVRYRVVGTDRGRAVRHVEPDRRAELEAKLREEQEKRTAEHRSIDNEQWWGG